MDMEKKFEEMDNFIEGFNDVFDEEKYDEYFNKEMDDFCKLKEDEKAEVFGKLFSKAIINKKYCLRRANNQLKSFIDIIDIIQNAIKYNASTDVVLDIIEDFKSNMEDDLNSVKKKMRYCKK